MRYFILLFLLFPILTYSQLSYDYEKRFQDSIPQSYNINPAVIRDHIYKRIPEKYKVDIYEKMSFLFASRTANRVSGYLNGVTLYNNMPELEKYINEILIKVTPEELKGDSFIHAYIVKGGEPKANMKASGHLFLNIGLLSEANDETFLAAIFARELAHYYLHHSVQYFIASQTGEFDLRVLDPNENMPNQFTVRQEKQADSLAFIWMEKSGYDIQGVLNSFKAFERIERRILCQSDKDFKFSEYNHPLTEERYNAINEYYQKKQGLIGSKYLVSEEKFKYFKEIAKPEILANYLKYFNHYACVETSFKYHIMDPDNPIYVEFLLESIRRACFVDINLWKRNFITNTYSDTLTVANYFMRKTMTNHLFSIFNNNIMAMSDEDISKIRASFYWKGEPKFKTYEEAFEFYYRGARALKSNECILSVALSYNNDKVTRNTLLQEYLACDNVKMKDYAKFLLGDTIDHQYPKRKLIVLNNIEASVKLGNDDFPIFSYGVENGCDVSCILDSVMTNYKADTSLYLPMLKRRNTSEYIKLKELYAFASRYIISEFKETDLYVLNPWYYEAFSTFNVNEIEFVNCVYNEEAVDKKTVSSYSELTDKSLGEFWKKSSNVKYMDVCINSVRFVNKKRNFAEYCGGSNKLKTKDTGYNQIIEELKLQMGTRDEWIKKNDTYYQTRN